MQVVMRPTNGTARAYLERAKVEIARVLSFRGSVTGVKASGTRIIVEFEINPKWDLPMSEKVKSLEEWIPAKVRTAFKVVSVSITDRGTHGQN
jgi:hypothetical protein